MCSHPCFIVPPYLLESLAQSSDTSLQQLANNTVETTNQIRDERSKLFTEKAAQIFSDQSTSTPQRKIVPDYLLEQLSTGEDVDDSVRESAKKSLQLSQALRAERGEESKTAQQTLVHGPVAFHRSVYDMETSKRDANLPGKPIRLEGQGPAKDPIVNEAYENCLHTLKFFNEKFNWTSFDGKNGVLVSSVHYGQQYGNAAWSYGQMLYGDGDNILGRFTACIDVIGHELTHGVTENTAQLDYSDESGALNEHVSDVFGIMVKQWVENKKAADADWLLGEGCLMPGIHGVALRNMKNPGTAYDDPKFGGKDPQPDHYSNKVIISDDYKGVHYNSGIPNKAFVLAAIEFGGYSWEKAGQIWWKTLSSPRKIPIECTFLQFADATVEIAHELYGDQEAKIVRKAWNTVGVARKH